MAERREVEAVSHTISPSAGRWHGLVLTCRALAMARSTVYAIRAREGSSPRPPRKRRPKTDRTDVELTERIREVIATSPGLGEGYRKVWTRLRQAGIRTSKKRVLRLMRETSLLAQTRSGRAHGPKATTAPSRPISLTRCGVPTPLAASPTRDTPPSSPTRTDGRRPARARVLR
jgi:hypothetical protein